MKNIYKNKLNYRLIEIENREFLVCDEFEKNGINFLMSTADSFNVDEENKSKSETLQKMYKHFGVTKSDVFACKQTHSTNIVEIENLFDCANEKNYEKNENYEKENYIGINNLKKENLKKFVLYKNGEEAEIQISTDEFFCEFHDADGLITRGNEILLMKFADCTPVIIFDKTKKILANIHSGWKGTNSKILKKTLNILKSKYNSDMNDIYVFFAPSISVDNFEVKDDLIELFSKTHNIEKYIINRENKKYFDMKTLIYDDAVSMGISEERIYTSQICTVDNAKMHSYRRDKEKSGRMYVLVQII